MMNTAASLSPTLEFLRRHAPFDQMAPAHLEYMAKRLKLGFYARNEVIVGPGDGPADRFYIIKQGRVHGEAADGAEMEEGAFELVSGECFPVGALLSRRPVRLIERAVEDTFCFELEREDFDYLLNRSAVFHDFCTRRIASLLDSALRSAQANSATRVSEDALSSPLQALLRRAPVACDPDTSLHQALHRMHQEHVGSIVVVDGNKRPVGVFTLHDVLARVALPQKDLATAIREVMTPNPYTLPATSLAYEAALLMTQHGFGHICVVDEGRLVGVLSESDLFSLQRVGLVSLSRAISEARSVDALARLELDVHRLIEQMLAQGASVAQLTQIISALNDTITRRILELVQGEMGRPSVPFTWLSFGSEGRFEQTLRTDQDNGILFITPAGRTPADVREELLPLARRVNEALDACGFPLCKGNIMASNPECCLSLEEWQARFSRWIDQGTPEHLLKSTIFFDFRALYGDPAPAEQLRSWLTERVVQNSRFRRQMAQNALRNRPPLGLFRDFVVASGGKHPNTIDLKIQGVTPFVDAARLIAFTARVSETNTVARLRAAAERGAVNSVDVASWAESYHYIQLLRMRTHRRHAEQGQALSNHVDPDTLNELDRRILKEAFRQARKLQAKIALEYQL
ncbi:MAG: DUF294 nucleotidyltransferase-like domain-containing protein [Thiohalomonadaceae bacterium]